MMIISLFARLACNICCFLYPAYASYKALSTSPANTPEADVLVERWLMYWAVVGTWTAVEAVVGWTFTWLPFYSLVKTLAFLYLSLPQSEGSSYIYRVHLAPFFNEHESDIDAFLASLRSRASSTLAGGLGWLWENVRKQLNIALPVQPQYGRNTLEQPAAPMAPPPTLQDPAAGTVQQLYGFVARYAGQYMPLALTALQAAAASATSNSRGHPASEQAEQVPEQMSMPVPIPTPSPHTYSDPNLRSRAYQHATQPQSGSSSAMYPNLGLSSASRLAPNHPRAASSPSGQLSSRSSDESVHTRSSGSGWQGEMSYETIRKEEAADAPSVPQRPGVENRRSSWFGWGGSGSDERPKVE